MLNFLENLGHALGSAWSDWRSRQQAYAELASLDDRSLADIGITRSEIPYVLSHGAELHGSGALTTPANNNLPHAA